MREDEYELLKQFYLDVEDSLTLNDYEVLLEENDFHICFKNKNEWRIKTACHNVDVSTAHQNLRFNLNNRVFTCFSGCCCSYNIYTLLQKRFTLLDKPKSSLEILKYICNYKNIPFNFKGKEIKPSNKSNWKNIIGKYNKSNNENEVKIYNKNDLNIFPKIFHEDWLEYGISEETLNKYNIRYYPYESQIVIPCNNNKGDFIGARIRNMNPNSKIKYKPLKLLNGFEYNFPTNDYFYGENFNSEAIKKSKTAWLVEAEKSVLKADTYYGDNNVTLGLYGSFLGKAQLKYLINLGVNKIVIMLDSDFKEIKFGKDKNNLTDFDIFWQKVMKIADMVKPYMQEVWVCYNNQGFDGYKFSPFDFDKDKYEILLDNMERIY